MQTRGVWGIEVSELDAMSRMEVSRIKSFITRTTDRFRPPYGSRIIESPRSCVFWGTTNSDGYLKDETGGRRFWPVKIGKINVDLLRDCAISYGLRQSSYTCQVPWWLTKKGGPDRRRKSSAGPLCRRPLGQGDRRVCRDCKRSHD